MRELPSGAAEVPKAPKTDGKAEAFHLLAREVADFERRVSEATGRPAMLTTWVAEHLAEEHGWRLEPGSPLHVHLIRMIVHLQVEFARREDETLNGNLRAVGDVRFSPDQYGLDEARG